jgi:hypothetical protein
LSKTSYKTTLSPGNRLVLKNITNPFKTPRIAIQSAGNSVVLGKNTTYLSKTSYKTTLSAGNRLVLKKNITNPFKTSQIAIQSAGNSVVLTKITINLNFKVMHPVARVPIKHFCRPPFATIFVV